MFGIGVSLNQYASRAGASPPPPPPSGLVWHNDSVDPASGESIFSYLSRHGGADTVNLVPGSIVYVGSNPSVLPFDIISNGSRWSFWENYDRTGSAYHIFELDLPGYQIAEIQSDAFVVNASGFGARASGVTFFDPSDPLNKYVSLVLLDNSWADRVVVRVYVDGSIVYAKDIFVAQNSTVWRNLDLKKTATGIEAREDGGLLPVTLNGFSTYTGAGIFAYTPLDGPLNDLNGFDDLKAYL